MSIESMHCVSVTGGHTYPTIRVHILAHTLHIPNIHPTYRDTYAQHTCMHSLYTHIHLTNMLGYKWHICIHTVHTWHIHTHTWCIHGISSIYGIWNLTNMHYTIYGTHILAPGTHACTHSDIHWGRAGIGIVMTTHFLICYQNRMLYFRHAKSVCAYMYTHTHHGTHYMHTLRYT